MHPCGAEAVHQAPHGYLQVARDAREKLIIFSNGEIRGAAVAPRDNPPPSSRQALLAGQRKIWARWGEFGRRGQGWSGAYLPWWWWHVQTLGHQCETAGLQLTPVLRRLSCIRRLHTELTRRLPPLLTCAAFER